jgi:hypothetical protein
MPVVEHLEDAPHEDAPHPLLAGVSPKIIAGHLFSEDRDRFRLEYEAALDEARRTYELAPVQDVVEHWRRIAVLQLDPEAFKRSVRSIAEAVTGEPTPEGEPFEVTRQKTGI